MNPRDVLNRLRWLDGALDEAVVRYRHRGAPGDERTIRGDRIDSVDRGWLMVRGGGPAEAGGRAAIPYHRILEIRRGGESLWRRRP